MKYIDETAIQLFGIVPFAVVMISILLGYICVVAVLSLFNIKGFNRTKGIKRELGYLDSVRSRDKRILRGVRYIRICERFIQASPMALPKNSIDYWQYNINRAGIKIPGGARNIRATEFYGVAKTVGIAFMIVNVLITVFLNTMLGIVSFFSMLVMFNVGPMIFLRRTVATKDAEIKSNFSDLYLMIHYVLLSDGSTPLSNLLRSYIRMTNSDEMIKFVDCCLGHIETHGEYEATRYIAKDYAEVPEVGKLMRLIRQNNEGGDVKPDLIGFRQELLSTKRYVLETRMDKIIAKAKTSFYLLMPILIQAIISAMSIYFSDIGLVSTFF